MSARSGDYVIYKFKAAHFALISTKDKKRGKARIFVDGRLRRTVKIVNLGTSGRPRFDVDGHVL